MITLVYDRYEDNNYWVHDTDNDVYYTVSGTFVPNSAAAVEWIRNYGINRRAIIASGTHTKLTYDTYGIVTSGTNATTADINDSLNRRYVTDAQLSQLDTLANSMLVYRTGTLKTSINSGIQTAVSIALPAEQTKQMYAVKVWFDSAANQHNKTIRGYLNGNVADQVFSVTEAFDEEVVTIEIEGVCGATASNQFWITEVRGDLSKNHGFHDYQDTTVSSISTLTIETDTTANGDLTIIGYRVLYADPSV